MPIPEYENLVEPMLKVLCADGEDAPKSLLVSRISDELQLDPVEAQAMLPSGTCTVLEHRSIGRAPICRGRASSRAR
jgi:restriction endonuclease Mrr